MIWWRNVIFVNATALVTTSAEVVTMFVLYQDTWNTVLGTKTREHCAGYQDSWNTVLGTKMPELCWVPRCLEHCSGYQDAWNTVLGTTTHVQVMTQNSVASTMANPCCYCCSDFKQSLGTAGINQHHNFFDLQFRSDCFCPTDKLIIFQTVPRMRVVL